MPLSALSGPCRSWRYLSVLLLILAVVVVGSVAVGILFFASFFPELILQLLGLEAKPPIVVAFLAAVEISRPIDPLRPSILPSLFSRRERLSTSILYMVVFISYSPDALWRQWASVT